MGERGWRRQLLARAWRQHGWSGLWSRLRDRARVRRLEVLDRDREYRLWLAQCVREHPQPAPEAATAAGRTRVLVFTPGRSAVDLAATQSSLRPLAGSTDLLALDAGAPLPRAEGAARVIGLAAGDVLVPGAVARLASALQASDERAVAYADEDLLSADGARRRPFLKPAWSPLLSLTYPGLYPGTPIAITGTLWDEVAADTPRGEGWVDAVFRALERARVIAHVPLPLSSRQTRGGTDPLLGSFAERRAAAERARKRHRLSGRLVPAAAPESLRLEESAGTPLPAISVLVPTRDRPEYLIPLGQALERERQRLEVELIFLDHETHEPRARDYLDSVAERGVARVLAQQGPFNFAAMINAGVEVARGELLLLLNNDTLPRSEGWIEALARAALLPGVAAAGALLLYADGDIQHAGVGLGIGTVSGHVHKGNPIEGSSPCVDPRIAREVTAVTGACLMVRRSDFEAVGGLDAGGLPVSFNDIDLCLKLGARGRRVVYEPAAVLTHYETRTREPEIDPAEIRRMHERWPAAIADDPYLPRGLTRLCEKPHLELWHTLAHDARLFRKSD